MSLLNLFGINFSSFGYVFGIDLLFWTWAIVTIIAFLDILIPDPIPFIDEIILIFMSLFLLMLMAFRGTIWFIQDVKMFFSSPGLLAFLITIIALLLGRFIYLKVKKHE